MEKIYIIEDDENIRNLLKIALEGFGFEAEGFAVSYTHLTLPTIA